MILNMKDLFQVYASPASQSHPSPGADLREGKGQGLEGTKGGLAEDFPHAHVFK